MYSKSQMNEQFAASGLNCAKKGQVLFLQGKYLWQFDNDASLHPEHELIWLCALL